MQVFVPCAHVHTRDSARPRRSSAPAARLGGVRGRGQEGDLAVVHVRVRVRLCVCVCVLPFVMQEYHLTVPFGRKSTT